MKELLLSASSRSAPLRLLGQTQAIASIWLTLHMEDLGKASVLGASVIPKPLPSRYSSSSPILYGMFSPGTLHWYAEGARKVRGYRCRVEGVQGISFPLASRTSSASLYHLGMSAGGASIGVEGR